MRARNRTIGIAISAVLLASSANSQWTAVELNGFAARGINGTSLVGESPAFGALLWLNPNQIVDLHPAGALRSYAYDIDGPTQVGEVIWPTGGRAALWTGSKGSSTDLNPANATRSVANAVNSGRQGGFAAIGGVQRAGWWQGTAASWVEVHPQGATASFVEDLTETLFVGASRIGGILHAGTWTGTPESWVSIHPPNASESVAYGAYGFLQTGYATFDSDHAALWSGTAESFVDLHPVGAHSSTASGIFGATQVGHTITDGIDHAAYWVSEAESFVNLHPMLDPRFTESWAYDVTKDLISGNTFVAGRAYDGEDSVAVLWTRGPDELAPHTLFRRTGTLVNGTVAEVAQSDDLRLEFAPGVVITTGQWPIVLDFVAQAPGYSTATYLSLFVETSATTTTAQCRLSAFDYDTGTFVPLHQGPSTLGDQQFRFDREDAARFISETGELKCRVEFKLAGPILTYPWRGKVDWVHWRIVP